MSKEKITHRNLIRDGFILNGDKYYDAKTGISVKVKDNSGEKNFIHKGVVVVYMIELYDPTDPVYFDKAKQKP